MYDLGTKEKAKKRRTVLTEPQKLAGNPIELCCQHCEFVAVSNLSQVRKGLGAFAGGVTP